MLALTVAAVTVMVAANKMSRIMRNKAGFLSTSFCYLCLENESITDNVRTPKCIQT